MSFLKRLWRRKPTDKILATSWKCNRCESVRAYVDGILTPPCGSVETIIHLGDTYAVACPLIPLDRDGKEIPFDRL